jgi:predicted permease
VALGLFLAQERPATGAAAGDAAALVALKLVAQPAATWLLAAHVFHLAPSATRVAVLLAALPTGTGPFMLAELYDRQAAVTARTVLASTVASLATISVVLMG